MGKSFYISTIDSRFVVNYIPIHFKKRSLKIDSLGMPAYIL